ncbi:MAG TPA: helix-turn-helix transcriptional regulator [Terriglobales bacterium]|nr:helix-turn-helix transcriptional regulator [Terriglobales bacterium]
MDANINLAQIGTELRKRRISRGLTQAELAKRANLSRALIIRAEQGDTSISIGNFAKLLGATGGELAVETARRPTLEEAADLFAEDHA